MEIVISLDDLYSIGTYGRLQGCATITDYPNVIAAIKKADPLEEHFVIREVYGHQELYSLEEWILFKKQQESWEKSQEEIEHSSDNINQPLATKIRQLDPELAELLKQQGMSGI